MDASDSSSSVHNSLQEQPVEIPSAANDTGRAQRSARKVRHLLLLLEDELRAFRDGSGAARDVFRNELDAGDVGYISSLLNMLGDENKFARWLKLTTNQFNYFKRKKQR